MLSPLPVIPDLDPSSTVHRYLGTVSLFLFLTVPIILSQSIPFHFIPFMTALSVLSSCPPLQYLEIRKPAYLVLLASSVLFYPTRPLLRRYMYILTV
ncbi:hypothetical protein M430DRAFT_210407 [Amorphotheca resinae ATCC 22711]|uniref:Uncharacterized protein n=1 Tax=Amorphotheca resinae ATCC 22711 TaxID=857342 RepID=A0A2T3B7L0_AMORE|nr:hypothetical protein M430DRAFT_210407 [Amorphotheca resinae ATCC 22711]PSS22866.1 hypothetical protein M430DRAFT_210407 [Amorphotheca resinae ATCC 22711]